MIEVEEYLNHNLRLVPIPSGQKNPVHAGWQMEENAVKSASEVNGHNIGLLHEYSGTCAIDIDDVEAAERLFEERGLSLVDFLLSNVQVISPNPGHAKVICRLPFPIPSKKIVLDKKDVLNFRCMGNQDVLPPSIHPLGAPYKWLGDWKAMAYLPAEIVTWWSELLTPQVTQPPAAPTSSAMITEALGFVSPDCDRKTWIEVGMALHYASPSNLELWREWSSKSTSKYNPWEIDGQWRSFKNRDDGIRVNSLYFHARKGGWRPDLEMAKLLFEDINVSSDLDMLLIGQMVPSFPIDCLPPILQDYCMEVAKRIGGRVEVAAAAGLIAAAGVADSRSRLWLADQYSVPPVLWAMVIAPPSGKKSPMAAPMFEPLGIIEREDRDRYRAALLIWEGMEARHAAQKKAYLSEQASPEALLMQNCPLPQVDELPKRPVPLRFLTSDTTSQKLVRLLEERPEGMACFLDEGSAWINKMTGKLSGDDRACWTQSYESRPYYFDRQGTGSIFLENMAVSVYMNVQPTFLRNHITDLQQDGLAQRFSPFIIMHEGASKLSSPIPGWSSLAPQWEHTLRSIRAVGRQDYNVSSEGRAILRKFEEWVEEMRKDHHLIRSPEGFQTAVGKLMGLFGRYILMFHLLENPSALTVSVDTILRAEAFIKEYLIYSIEAFHCQEESFDKWLFDWLMTGSEETVTEGDIRRAARRPLEGKHTSEQREIVGLSTAFLEKLGILMEITGTGSRTKSFMIHPTVRDQYADHRRQVSTRKQAWLNRIREIAEGAGVKIKERFARGFNPYRTEQ
jgi:hypothetical protein